MRVLHCIYDDPSNPWVAGGGSLRVLELYRRLTGRVEATVASGSFPGARDEVRDGVRYMRLGVPSPYALSRLSYGAAATRLLARGEYDVGVFDFSGYTPIRLPSNRPTAIVVHMLHGTTSAGRWGRIGSDALRGFERWMLARTGEVCVTSDWLRGELEPVLPSSTRFHTVRSGVPDEFFAVERREAGHLLYYGRFDVYQKGLDVLLDAMALLEARGIPLPLRMLGRGKDAALVRRMIDERGLGHRITLHDGPSRADVLQAMGGAVALLHPSRFEGLPMVPAEAMAAGVPVIATDVGAVAEIVDAGSGVLIPPGDAEALAAAVAALQDPEDRVRRSVLARRSAGRFRWDRVADDHMAFLEAVAGARSDRGGASPIAPSVGRPG